MTACSGKPFWATVCKTVCPMLSDHCPVCLSVTLVYCGQTVGWIKMKLGMSWPQPWPHCVRWGSSSPPPKGHSPQFSAHIYCGQMSGWIKMPLGMEVSLGPGDFVVDRDPAPPPKKGAEPPPKFWLMSIVAKRLDGSRRHLARRWAFVQAILC